MSDSENGSGDSAGHEMEREKKLRKLEETYEDSLVCGICMFTCFMEGCDMVGAYSRLLMSTHRPGTTLQMRCFIPVHAQVFMPPLLMLSRPLTSPWYSFCACCYGEWRDRGNKQCPQCRAKVHGLSKVHTRKGKPFYWLPTL